MSNKTISINPSLFSVGGSKTKKNREKKSKPTAVPLISPNVLKNKLLKRIKEHKQKETQDLANNKRKLDNVTNVEPVKNFENEMLKYNDEFTDSINYLQTFSKQKKLDAEKRNHEYLKQRQKEELERRTIRNYHELNVNLEPSVNIDLPDELIQPIITEPFKINSHQKPEDVPYGVLKGGLKPSYREWARTQRNNIVTNPNSSLIIQGGMNSQQNARENRLNLLRQKIKNKNEETKVDPILTENLIRRPNPITQPIVQPQVVQSQVVQPTVQPTVQPQTVQPTVQPQTVQPQTVQPIPEQNGGKIIATKHITKKTIKRKYTLGRSNIKKIVSVLIKDRGTRKKVLTAQKDLKRKNINDIKLYLREHNLIKIGSNAPNDVLRKLYESAMLSGEITNNNTETLLHNLSKEDKQL
jgi:hypothetical protein